MSEMKTLPPPARKAVSAPPQPAQQRPTAQAGRFEVISGKVNSPQRIVLYGPGGIGKSTLASLAPNPVFLDIEGGTGALDIPRIAGIKDFAGIRAVLQSSTMDAFDTIVLDSGTRAEEWAIAHTLKTVAHEKGHYVASIEGYGYGRGLQHVYDQYLLLLADLDSQVRRGKNVIVICHDCISEVPNPKGDDYIRFEPHLQAPKSGKASIRNRVVQWADHVLFLCYDVIGEDGKAKGTGTRTVWTFELPTHVAKSRSVREAAPFNAAGDAGIWRSIFAQGGAR